MASAAAHKRLTKEFRNMESNPVPYIRAVPNESNILEWHYVITGSPDTPFENGEYHGTLTFPADYPFKPPAIRMMTPSGRFQPNMRLCLSISDYHPDTWNPAWSVSTILVGLQSFMNSDEITSGGINSTDAQKREYAKKSIRWNVEHNLAYCRHYPDDAEYYRELLELEDNGTANGNGNGYRNGDSSSIKPLYQSHNSEQSSQLQARREEVIEDFESDEDDIVDFEDDGSENELIIDDSDEEGEDEVVVIDDDDKSEGKGKKDEVVVID